MSAETHINIKICNRNYRIKVAIENESHVRKNVDLINKKTDEFHKLFPGRDEQDYMAMTLIDFISTYTASDNQNKSTAEVEIMEKIQRIHKLSFT